MIQYNHVALLWLGCAQLQLDTWNFSGNTFVYGFIEKCSLAVSQFWISMCYQNESQPLHLWFMTKFNHVSLLCVVCAQLQLDTWKFSGNIFVYGFIEKCSLAVSKFWISMLPKRISTAACMVHDTVQPCSIALSRLLRSYN